MALRLGRLAREALLQLARVRERVDPTRGHVAPMLSPPPALLASLPLLHRLSIACFYVRPHPGAPAHWGAQRPPYGWNPCPTRRAAIRPIAAAVLAGL